MYLNDNSSKIQIYPNTKCEIEFSFILTKIQGLNLLKFSIYKYYIPPLFLPDYIKKTTLE